MGLRIRITLESFIHHTYSGQFSTAARLPPKWKSSNIKWSVIGFYDWIVCNRLMRWWEWKWQGNNRKPLLARQSSPIVGAALRLSQSWVQDSEAKTSAPQKLLCLCVRSSWSCGGESSVCLMKCAVYILEPKIHVWLLYSYCFCLWQRAGVRFIQVGVKSPVSPVSHHCCKPGSSTETY